MVSRQYPDTYTVDGFGRGFEVRTRYRRCLRPTSRPARFLRFGSTECWLSLLLCLQAVSAILRIAFRAGSDVESRGRREEDGFPLERQASLRPDSLIDRGSETLLIKIPLLSPFFPGLSFSEAHTNFCGLLLHPKNGQSFLGPFGLPWLLHRSNEVKYWIAQGMAGSNESGTEARCLLQNHARSAAKMPARSSRSAAEATCPQLRHHQGLLRILLYTQTQGGEQLLQVREAKREQAAFDLFMEEHELGPRGLPDTATEYSFDPRSRAHIRNLAGVLALSYTASSLLFGVAWMLSLTLAVATSLLFLVALAVETKALIRAVSRFGLCFRNGCYPNDLCEESFDYIGS